MERLRNIALLRKKLEMDKVAEKIARRLLKNHGDNIRLSEKWLNEQLKKLKEDVSVRDMLDYLQNSCYIATEKMLIVGEWYYVCGCDKQAVHDEASW